jgi:hypothetical protein
MREFVPPAHAIRAQTATDIAAPPEYVAALYRDVEKWSETFPATIAHAQVTETGDNWQEIEVDHKKEGQVPNTLIFLSNTEIGLEERKQIYNASFLNKFEPATQGGTRYILTAYISLNGIFKVLKPFLKSYVHGQALKQMKNYVLDPLKMAAEKKHAQRAIGQS